MRIVIDLQGAQTPSRFRGIGRYSLSLARAIAKTPRKHEIFILLNRMLENTILSLKDEFEKFLPPSNIVVWGGVAPTDFLEENNRWRRESSELLRESMLEMLQPDIVLNMSMIEGYDDNAVYSVGKFRNIPTASIFYDVIPLLQPEHYLDPNPLYKKYYFYRTEQLKLTNLLLSISESSRQEAIKYLGMQDQSVVNITAAVSKKFSKEHIDPIRATEVLKKFKIHKKFILITGATDERKNHLRLIEAFSKLPKPLKNQYQLVIGGGIPVDTHRKFTQHSNKCRLGRKDIVFTFWLEDEELLALYTLCELFVYPSWHEGFGLPILEAMQCGAAVIGSNNTSIPEIIGDKNALFDPFDTQSITHKIAQYLQDKNKRDQLAAQGIELSKNFSWDICASKALDAIEKWHISQPPKTPTSKTREETLKILFENLTKIESHPADESDILGFAQAVAYNYPQTFDKKQLLIDISELVIKDVKSGIQRVVRNILREMLINPPAGYRVEPVYATHQQLGYYYAKQFTAHFMERTTKEEDSPIDLKSGDQFLVLDLSPDVQRFQESTYEWMQEFGVKVHFLIHDLLPYFHPEWFEPNKHIQKTVANNFSAFLEVAAKADSIICVSKQSADDFEQWAKEKEVAFRRGFHLGYSHNGADIDNDIKEGVLNGDELAQIAKIEAKESFLMVGTIEPRKAQEQVLDAFELLWREGIDVLLIIVGKQGWHMDKFIEKIESHSELNKRLLWLNSISDAFLLRVYESSDCLIAASLGEGFGLPLIEAAQKGLPIIARDIPIFQEVAGEYAYYFQDNQSTQDLAQSINKWRELYSKDLHPKSNSMPWLTWKESSKKLLESIGISSN